ncbi:WSC domain-containing protein [Chaetomidium leptoderma]|uniref:WSC domain-containing protein n=1 Tax=Chaetomidium leptoderma TaxID=669021 RepID=A0AAN6ZX18_9PEZI|nr:WSC domain-containing protein [Chaetomidium leptoderma]
MHPLTLLLLPLLPLAATAQEDQTSSSPQQQQQLEIVNDPSSSGYVYHGCYNETTDLPDTTGVRALHGGAHLIRPGNMTVDMCWDFCRTGAGDSSGGTSGRFRFAGLEYARECWCAETLSSLSEKLPDSACDLPCEGNTTQACGGNLKLSVYMAGAATARVAWAAGLVAVGAMSLTLL